MHLLTFGTVAVMLVANLLFAELVESSRYYNRRRDLDSVKPVSELGWNVPLQSGQSDRSNF